MVSKESAALQRSYTGVRKWREVLSVVQGREGAEAVLKDWGMAWHGMAYRTSKSRLEVFVSNKDFNATVARKASAALYRSPIGVGN